MSETVYQPPTLQRIASGIPGLDTILYGGFLKGGMYLVVGPPGAGKTILGNQLGFSHVKDGGRVAYVTLLAESHARMLSHLQSLAFFDPAPVANSLYYVSGYTVLEQEGLTGLLTLLRQIIRDHHASVLIIDGLITAREIAPSPVELKQFLHELHVYTGTVGCTTFLLTQFDEGSRTRPEFIMVDGLVELNDRLSDVRSVRELEVHKFRGSKCLRGRHLFEISDAGMTVHPRTEALLATPKQPPRTFPRDRMHFAIPTLDQMLAGGLLPGTTTVLLGAPGAGKTLLGLHFLAAGARNGEQGLHFGFSEAPPQLEEKSNRMGLGISPFLANGQIEMLWHSPLETIPDVIAERLLEAVERRKVSRLVIDGLNGFQRTVATNERLVLFLYALTTTLNARGLTTLSTVEIPELFGPMARSPIDGVTTLADNIIFLRYVELRSQLYRLLSIMKMRDSSYDPAIREFRITTKGIDVASTFQSAEDILTGMAHPSAINHALPDLDAQALQEPQT